MTSHPSPPNDKVDLADLDEFAGVNDGDGANPLSNSEAEGTTSPGANFRMARSNVAPDDKPMYPAPPRTPVPKSLLEVAPGPSG